MPFKKKMYQQMFKMYEANPSTFVWLLFHHLKAFVFYKCPLRYDLYDIRILKHLYCAAVGMLDRSGKQDEHIDLND